MVNLQLFGGGGSSFGKSGGGATSGGTSEPVAMPKSIGRQDVADWVSTQNALDYARNAPDIIEINGIEFVQTSHDAHMDSRGNVSFGTDYQSTVQATNGEWPTIHVAVQQYRRGGFIHYKFDRSSSTGTRLI